MCALHHDHFLPAFRLSLWLIFSFSSFEWIGNHFHHFFTRTCSLHRAKSSIPFLDQVLKCNALDSAPLKWNSPNRSQYQVSHYSVQNSMHQPLILLSAKVKFAISFHCCLVDRIAKREMAHRIFLQECCKGQCLKAIGQDDAEELVFNCLMEVEFLTQTQKHEYLFQKLRHCAEGVTEGGYLQCDYSLGQGVCGKRAYGVCHKCFQNVYNIGQTQLYNIRAKVKAGILTTVSGHREGDDSATLGGCHS